MLLKVLCLLVSTLDDLSSTHDFNPVLSSKSISNHLWTALSRTMGSLRFLSTSRLARQRLIDAGKRWKTSESEGNVLLLTTMAVPRISALGLVLEPLLPRGRMKKARWSLHPVPFRRGAPSFESAVFYSGQQARLLFLPEGDTVFFFRNCPRFLQRLFATHTPLKR